MTDLQNEINLSKVQANLTAIIRVLYSSGLFKLREGEIERDREREREREREEERDR